MAEVVFEQERCKGCALCVKFCPKGIIVLDKRINDQGFHPATVIHMEKCIACGMCALMCPDTVIRVKKDSTADNGGRSVAHA